MEKKKKKKQFPQPYKLDNKYHPMTNVCLCHLQLASLDTYCNSPNKNFTNIFNPTNLAKISQRAFSLNQRTEIEPRNTIMSSSSFLSSSILNIPTSKTPSLIIPSPKVSSLDNPFPKIKIPPRKCRTFAISFHPVKSSADSAMIVEDNLPAETPSNSGGMYDEEDAKAAEAQGKLGTRVKVKIPLKVYHVPKVPELELTGQVGTLKQYVAVHKGKRISANLPYKVEFVVDNIEGREKPVKFLAHLKEDEFEYLD